MTRRHLAAAVLCVLAAAGIFAATTDDSVPDQKYLDYAKGFASYTARVKVPCDGKVCEASATLIADHWALTAAHVVGDAGECKLHLGDKVYEIDRIVTHPEFAGKFGKNDLALLHSKESFGLDFYPPLSDGGEAAGDLCSIAGYGVHGKMSVGHEASDGRLRAGTNHIERIDDHLIVCTASPRKSSLEICIAPGDSGGPLFCRGKLAGVNSLTMADKGPLKSRAGEESGHVRVSLYREWIEGVVK